MNVGQSTDDAAAWRRSCVTYVPPDFDLIDFDDDLAASGVVRDLCSWRGRQGCPANEVALSWACESRKVLVATKLSKEARWATPREEVLRLVWSRAGANFLGRLALHQSATRVNHVAADETVWRPWVVPVDSGSLQRCEVARVDDVMVGYGYRVDRLVLIAAVGGSGQEWALRTLTGERALSYSADPYAQPSRL